MVSARSRIARTPTVLQMESVECGAAALSMMLGYYGRFVPLAQLRHECGVSRDGSKANNVLKAGRLHHLLAKGFSKPLEQLRSIACPYIVFWQFNHYLVVEGIDGDTVHLNDPAVGHRTVTWEEFDKAYTGVMLMMEPGPDFKKAGSPPSALPGIWWRIQGNLLPLLFVFIAGVLLALPGVVIPTLIRVFLDSVVVEQRIGWFRPLIVGMGVAMVLQAALKWLQLSYLRRLQVGLAAKMAGQFFWHLLQLPIRFYSQRYPGEIVNRSYLNDKVAATIAGPLATTMVELFTMLIYAAVLLSYSVSLTLIGIVFAAANFFALQRLSKVRTEANMRLAKEEGMVQGQTIAGIQGIETLKGSGLEDGFFAKWCGYFANASNARQRLEFSTQSLAVLPLFLEALAMVLILVIGGFQVIEGHISIGFLIAFQSLMTSFLAPVSTLVNLGAVLQELHGDVLRLDDVRENPTVRRNPPTSAPLPEEVQLAGRLELVDVTFGYSPLEPPLVEGLNLRVEPGHRVALVGGSGSGKSTVSKLICGLVEPWSGEILFDGQTRENLPDGVLSTSLSMVEQDIFLFEGTVRENLTIWDRTVSDQALLDACRDAEILDTISAIPGGFGGMLAEGGRNLSGGQRQRLEIARALVTTPSVLVLDEATSALDADTEARIDENLRRRGCTCVIVAHRLSTIRDCDEIIVFEKGKVVERGNHEELWAAGGAYARLLEDHDNVRAEGDAA